MKNDFCNLLFVYVAAPSHQGNSMAHYKPIKRKLIFFVFSPLLEFSTLFNANNGLSKDNQGFACSQWQNECNFAKLEANVNGI